MLNILLRKMWCVALQKCIFASNAFWHQMHFCTAEHFPKENVRWTFSFGKCTPKCILASNAFVTFCVTKCTHQMHFCIKCIFASNAFLHSQNAFWHQMHFCIKCIFASNIFLRTFSFGKCSASNTFLHQIHFCTATINFITKNFILAVYKKEIKKNIKLNFI